LIAIIAASIVAVFMTGELWLSRRNERALLRRGAVAVEDPVYPTMRWAYPGAFVAMAAEGVLAGPAPIPLAIAGAGVLTAAKMLKYWAIVSLGVRWTYRVFVLPGAPLVRTGPYRFLRHPNYVAVVGELFGMACVTGAWATGPLGVVCFSWLLTRRIRAEEKAIY
jgi:methyltransferase